MKITTTHYLDAAKNAPIAGGALMPVRRALIIHHTNGGTAKSSIEHLKKTGLAIHLMIERDGTIYQCRPFNRSCGHAGTASKWRDPNTGNTYANSALNACSIGIELCNAGDLDSVRKKYSKLPPKYLAPWGGGKKRNWEDFPKAQVDACFEAAKAIVARYNLDDVTGHYFVAPTHRDDPSPAFPLKKLRVACGFQGLPEIA